MRAAGGRPGECHHFAANNERKWVRFRHRYLSHEDKGQSQLWNLVKEYLADGVRYNVLTSKAPRCIAVDGVTFT